MVTRDTLLSISNALLSRVTRRRKRFMKGQAKKFSRKGTPALDAPRNDSFTSLRDMVLRRVRADIVSGHSAPGTMYSVPTLADELGVSTTPVREALLELSQSGLVTPMRNRGFRVEATSLEELKHGFALRDLL
jgi:DNA-binding GntR family transcriptional regulator